MANESRPSVTMDLEQMIDMALHSPEIGFVNFRMLHALLHVICRKLNIMDQKVEIRGMDSKQLVIASPKLSVTKPTASAEDQGVANNPKSESIIIVEMSDEGRKSIVKESNSVIQSPTSQEEHVSVVSAEDGVEKESAHNTDEKNDSKSSRASVANSDSQRKSSGSSNPGQEENNQSTKEEGDVHNASVANANIISTEEGANTNKEDVETGEKEAKTTKDLINSTKEDANTTKGDLNSSKEDANTTKGDSKNLKEVVTEGEEFNGTTEEIRETSMNTEHAQTTQEDVETTKIDANASDGKEFAETSDQNTTPDEKNDGHQIVNDKTKPKRVSLPDQELEIIQKLSQTSVKSAGPAKRPSQTSVASTSADKATSSKTSVALEAARSASNASKSNGPSCGSVTQRVSQLFDEVGLLREQMNGLLSDPNFQSQPPGEVTCPIMVNHIQEMDKKISLMDQILHDRFLFLESKLNDHDGQINGLDTIFSSQLSNFQDQITDLESDVQDLFETVGQSKGNDKQKRIQDIQEQLSTLHTTTVKLSEDKGERDTIINSLLEQVDFLKTVKADRNFIEEALAERSGQFDAACQDLGKGLEDTISKLTEQEVMWQSAMDDIQREINNKLEKAEMQPLKELLDKRMRDLQEKLQEIKNAKDDVEAAGAKAKYLRNLNCLSCDQKVIFSKTEDIPRVPLIKPMTTRQSVKTLDKTGRPRSHHVSSGLHLCNRYCGGSHTTTTATQRTHNFGRIVDHQLDLQVRPLSNTSTNKQADHCANYRRVP